MAKIVNGLCDGILTSVVRAWDADGAIDGLFRGRPKRILVAPAMNSAMARHPITARQLRVLEEDWGVGRGGEGGDAANGDGGEGRQQQQQGWVEVVRWQDSKALACGDVGIGESFVFLPALSGLVNVLLIIPGWHRGDEGLEGDCRNS
jgi:phosphopantothenoylcysteine decarboxylase